jgi:hydroxymethylglutaryl-CoA lyase
MRLPADVRIVEVGPRDGLQNEAVPVPVADKVALCRALAAAGLREVEAGAFVSPRWVPQMAGTAEVYAALPLDGPWTALVPNAQGWAAARAAGARRIAVFTAATESFSQRNTNVSIAGGLARFAPIIAEARAVGVSVRGYVSCATDCPYEGPVPPAQAADVTARLFALGCDDVSVGDTVGRGTPARVQAMLDAVAAQVPRERIGFHAHDTFGQGVANVYAALEQGIAIIDASVAGLGGCPYAPGAAGNVATEDVIYLLGGLGIAHGADLHAVAAAGRAICAVLGRAPASKTAQALAKG